MTRRGDLRALIWSCGGAALYLVAAEWYDGIRAPWTGVTLAGAACAFVAAGYFGRGWRAPLWAAAVAVAATVLLDSPFGRSEFPESAGPESCDPACISREVVFAGHAVLTALLALLGLALRRGIASLAARRRPSTDGP